MNNESFIPAKELLNRNKTYLTDAEVSAKMNQCVNMGLMQCVVLLTDNQISKLLSIGYEIKPSVLYKGESVISWQEGGES